MKYEAGAHVQDLRIVVRPSRNYVEAGVPMIEPAIIVQFENGEFDSLEWQIDGGHSDELRELVERKIEKDPHFGQISSPRGFWHMTALTKREDVVMEPVEIAEQCSHIELIDGVSVPCTKAAVPGTGTCDDHILETV